jgi:flagellar hook-associated protein 2
MATTAVSTTSSLDTIAAQYRAMLVSTSVAPLQTQSSTLSTRVSSLSALKTKLNALYESARGLARIGSSSPFASFSIASSQTTVADGTATSSAAIGSHTIDSVTRLAKADILLSSRLTGTDTSMITSLGAGVKTFSINGTQVTVTLTDGQTDDQVMSAIAGAVNNTAGVGVSASVLHVDGTHTELALTSRTTGTASRISSVTEGNSNLAALLGFGGVTFTDTPGTTPRTMASSTQAGFIEGYSGNLDALFSMNGVSMTRGKNSITDAVNGLTLNLKGTSATPVTLTVAPNNADIEKSVTDFITNYNSIIGYLQSQTSIDAKAGTRGAFADDPNVRYLASDLRALLLHSVSSVDAGAPAVLSAVGIKTADDGTLSLSDLPKFEAALASNPKQVSDLFNSSNGIATLMQTRLRTFVSYGGSLDIETKSSNRQIKTLADRMTVLNARIDKQVTAYKQQFSDIQALLVTATQQQQIISSFMSYGA